MSDVGQTERLGRGGTLGQNPAKYNRNEPGTNKDPNAVGSQASTASTGGAGEKIQKRADDGKEQHGEKEQLNTMSASEQSKPIPQLLEEQRQIEQ